VRRNRGLGGRVLNLDFAPGACHAQLLPRGTRGRQPVRVVVAGGDTVIGVILICLVGNLKRNRTAEANAAASRLASASRRDRRRDLGRAG
jgi:hypothetical protein